MELEMEISSSSPALLIVPVILPVEWSCKWNIFIQVNRFGTEKNVSSQKG